ncbi:hypothetical protein FAM21834_02140 [Lentilactobacillus parabuchneri]|uniref:Uncharacterized protein n=1 Tax=Lentilactobacillus parabuchneri TaxID=152331 RepID=A0A1X1FCL4_9LACO|nr:hypothetical protein [Lentilactobacillus parabuchneri]APR08314.1 hypothetical protein FAM21731_02177 [Lentilactobacillus parabuchneri]ORN02474.1 hypothetical protein FAM21829_02052 [Lentilactobacillus parabuchneri]ORN06495.1 hypothetical protein FAM21834_02140 [Lentilactobacillus parabuchneri]ORN26203.1 hypothetical protein FAM23169_02103 [Lentilactobacillus parabuchneri]TLQ32209.1 hypothetical protein FEZ39_03650 [Lentilactobacillus parabuchneri]
MSDCKHPYTPMKQTSYGYTSKEEMKIDKQLDKDLKKRLRKEGAFNLHKKEKSCHAKYSRF